MAAGTGLKGSTHAVLNLSYIDDLDLSNVLDRLEVSGGTSWSYGTGANQMNLLWHDQRSTDDTGETIDVYAGGAEVDAFGNPLTMEAIKLCYIKNTHATLTLEIFGNTSLDLLLISGTTDAIEIPPGGVFFWTCPTEAGIDTTTNIKLFIASKTAATITYDIVLGGLD